MGHFVETCTVGPHIIPTRIALFCNAPLSDGPKCFTLHYFSLYMYLVIHIALFHITTLFSGTESCVIPGPSVQFAFNKYFETIDHIMRNQQSC